MITFGESNNFRDIFSDSVKKWGACSRCLFGPNSAFDSKKVMTFEKTHPTLYYYVWPIHYLYLSCTNLIIHLTSQIMILYKIVFLWFYIISISADSSTINFDRINRSKWYGRNRNIRKPSLREIKFELGNKLIIARTRICTSWTKMII